jgi:hypothetical protein
MECAQLPTPHRHHIFVICHGGMSGFHQTPDRPLHPSGGSTPLAFKGERRWSMVSVLVAFMLALRTVEEKNNTLSNPGTRDLPYMPRIRLQCSLLKHGRPESDMSS